MWLKADWRCAVDITVVGEASNGAEAVELVEVDAPHVAALDISMPVLNGIEATKKIEAVRPEIAVLILSSYDDDHYVVAILSAGAAGYLLKDVPASDVVEAVHKIHAGEAVLHPAIAKKVLYRFVDGRTDDAKSAGERLEMIQLTEREQRVLRLAACGRTNMGR